MDKTELLNVVVEKLKPLIQGGQFICMKCHRPLDGSFINTIDVDGQKIWYTCPVENCYNNGRTGFRTFRALKIVLPTRDVPSDIASLKAPPPPKPEDVEWDGEEDSDDDDDGIPDDDGEI